MIHTHKSLVLAVLIHMRAIEFILKNTMILTQKAGTWFRRCVPDVRAGEGHRARCQGKMMNVALKMMNSVLEK